MSTIPTDRLYAKSHEWLHLADDGTALVGITDYAQDSLGDITFVELPAIGAVLETGANFGVVESVKAASDLYAPAAGTVLAVNAELENAPELVNQEPFTAGWMLKIQLRDASAAQSGLLDAAAYESEIA